MTRPRLQPARILPVLPLTLALLAGCGSSPAADAGSMPATMSDHPMTGTMSDKPMTGTMSDKPMTGTMSDKPMTAGAYLSAADFAKMADSRAGTKIVYFFHAPWCPTCRAADAALTSTGVPAGLTVVKVDFDTATDLRSRYGVTQQHTFVQVDRAGDKIASWSGSGDGAAILAATR